VTAARTNGNEALAIGLADLVVGDGAALDGAVRETCNQVLKCAPEAIAVTKRLMQRAANRELIGQILDDAAASFAAAVRGPEGREGTSAFMEKRTPSWVTQVE
jgi:isohexenylglutaconyl-CoA hydratase